MSKCQKNTTNSNTNTTKNTTNTNTTKSTNSFSTIVYNVHCCAKANVSISFWIQHLF